MTTLVHIDPASERVRRGAARLLGVKPHSLSLWLIQNGGELDCDRLPRTWLEHAVTVLEQVQAEHGAVPMADVLEMLAWDPHPGVFGGHLNVLVNPVLTVPRVCPR